MKVIRSDNATCFIVPASFITMRSAAASVVEVADVPPSIMFSSVVVTVAPSRIPISVEVSAASADAPPDWHEDRAVKSASSACFASS